MDVHSMRVCADDDHTTSAPSTDANRADGDNDGDTATGEVLAWGSPALSLALERVFEFCLADEIDLRLRGKTSVVARVETARWIIGCATGPLRGSSEFCAAARRAARSIEFIRKRVGDVWVHQWSGLAGLGQPPDITDGRGSLTLVIGRAGSGKTYALGRLCASMTQAIARASGQAGAPYVPYAHHDYMDLGPHADRPIDDYIASHLSLRPHGRVALVYDKGRDYVENAEKLCARGFHVMVTEYPEVGAPLPSVIDRVLVALGPRDSRCREDALSAHVATIVGIDAAALKALFDAAPDYAYLWFEPADGRFGAGRTVVTLSRASDFETADGSAPPLDPRQVL